MVSPQIRAFSAGALVLLATIALAGNPKPTEPALFDIHITASPAGRVKAGTRIELHVTMTNNSKLKVTTYERDPGTDYDIDIRDEANHLVAMTKYGHTLKFGSPGAIHLGINRNIAVTLTPGASADDVIPLSDMYHMEVPGKYCVNVKRKSPAELGSRIATSNMIAITVVN
jgi:hypothetical protein